MSRMVSFLVLVGIIVFVGFLFYRVMASFLLPLFLAALLVVVFRPLHRWFLLRCRGRPRLAAGLTTITVMLIVLVPAALIVTLGLVEASLMVAKFNDKDIRDNLSSLRGALGLEMPYADELHYFEASFQRLPMDAAAGATAKIDEHALLQLNSSLGEFQARLTDGRFGDRANEIEAIRDTVEEAREARVGSVRYQVLIQQAAGDFRRLKTSLLGGEYRARIKEFANPTDEEIDRFTSHFFSGAPDWFRTIGGVTGSFTMRLLFGIFILTIGLHFFLADGPAMVSSVMRLSPLDDRHERELFEEFDRVSRAVVVATLLSAVVQGVLAGLGFWLAGLESIFLLTLLTTVFAMVPFVGAASIWVPASLYLFFFEERYLAAVLLAAYGAAIVSMADNFIKPLVLQGQSNLHPLLALLSVLGGVQALGPIGVLVGPMVVVFLQTSLNILHRELMALERQTQEVDG